MKVQPEARPSCDQILKHPIIQKRIEYFKIFGFNFLDIKKQVDEYLNEKKLSLRTSYFNGKKTYQIFYSTLSAHLRKQRVEVSGRILTKDEFNIYSFIKDKVHASINDITEAFGFHSIRAAKYHVDKLKHLGLIEQVGYQGSQNCFYRT